VDKIPPLRIDLDFLDSSGYVIIPVDSPAVPVDAKPADAPPRPVKKLQLTQTLDERQADKGKLVLEVKATALGLVPKLDQVLAFQPKDLDIVKTDDQGVSVSKFDADGDDTAVVSERTWMLTLRAKSDLPEPPKLFHFGSAQIDGAEMTYQRYNDADLVSVGPEVVLGAKIGGGRSAWPWVAAAAGVALLALLAGMVVRLWRRPKPVDEAWKLPEPLTPFTVMGLLRQIQRNNGFDAARQAELQDSIAGLERRYFAAEGNGEFDLKRLAEDWIRRTR
jgi:hypothetical protein